MDGVSASEPLPVRLVVTDDLERSRLTVFFRLLLVIPHVIVLALYLLAAVLVALMLWFLLIATGRAPGGMQSFVASYVRYSVQVSAYVHLAAAPYPAFGGGVTYPVDVEIDMAERQSRLGVIARLLLAVPALLVAAAVGGSVPLIDAALIRSPSSNTDWSAGDLAGVAAVLAWFATMIRGRTPRGLRDLAAYGIGYLAQVSAYLLLVTDRYPTSDPALIVPDAELPPHPVRLELEDGLERSRLTVFFRVLLAIPHLLWLALWSVLLIPVLLVAWLVALVIGRVPEALHRFVAARVRYGAHVGAFLFVIGGPFPGFVGAAGSYPVGIAIDPAAPQRRARTLFRLVLALPALLLSAAYSGAMIVVGVLGWWASLFTGRMPEGLRNLGAVAIRYSAQAEAYLFLLTDSYPYSAPVVGEPVAALVARRRPPDSLLTAGLA